MKRLLLIGLSFGLQVVLGQASSNAQSTTKQTNISEGPQLQNYDAELKKLFPSVTRVVERPFLPRTSGGTTFTGLVARLLGEATHSQLEAIDVRRYIYEAYNGTELVGVAHGSEYQRRDGPRVRVDIFYDTNGVIRDMRLGGIPDGVLKKLHASGTLRQFVGRVPEDFEIRRNRRGSIAKRGDFLTSHKNPGDAESRKYFELIVRSVRYNAAFMDVAFFITKHPNLDNDSRKLRVRASSSGPEAYVSSAKVIENSEDGSLLLLNGNK
jgi:hypothetical protein